MDYQELKEQALNSIHSKIQTDQIFVLRDLFLGADWEGMSSGDRRSFGRFFSNEVNEGKIPSIEKVKKANNNHTRYRKL